MKAVQPQRSHPALPGEAHRVLSCAVSSSSAPSPPLPLLQGPCPNPLGNGIPVPTTLNSPRGEKSEGTKRPRPGWHSGRVQRMLAKSGAWVFVCRLCSWRNFTTNLSL